MLVSVPCGTRGLWAVWGGSSQEPLSAETHRQAVPRVCVLFPPPAGAVVLVVSSVANRRPHGSTTHRAVAAALGVVVGAFHRQFHATVLLQRQREKAEVQHTDHEMTRTTATWTLLCYAAGRQEHHFTPRPIQISDLLFRHRYEKVPVNLDCL